jgi:predicted MFS family arabinose efflux permease
MKGRHSGSVNTMQVNTQHSINSVRTLIATCAAGVAGVLIFGILPIMLGGFAEKFALDDVATGTLGAVYFGCYALIALSSVLWVKKVNWRRSSMLGITAMIAGLSACLWLPQYQGAMLGLALTGIGAAMVNPISFAVIAYRHNKDRDYAIKLIPEQLIPGILLIVTASFFIEQLSIFKFLFLLISLLVITLILCRWIPVNPLLTYTTGTTESNTNPITKPNNQQGLLGLLALNLYFMGFAGLWAFLERIGDAGKLDAGLVGQLLALGLVSSAIGPFIAAFIGDRFGRALPVIAAALGTLLPLVLISGKLTGEMTGWGFGLILAIMPLMYYFGIAYFFGIIADTDQSGRFAALIPFSLAVGAALGPYLFGLTKSVYGLEAALLLVASVVSSGCLLIIRVNTHLKQPNESEVSLAVSLKSE